jgi:F-type H+-transporting ATPase subunit delta
MSANFRIINNYACALLRIAQQITKAEEILKQISSIIELLKRSDLIKQSLYSPVINKTTKTKIIHLIAIKYHLNTLCIQFLDILIKNSRFHLIEQIAIQFRESIKNRQGFKTAKVSSASKLNPRTIKSLNIFLESKFNKKIDLTITTDPSLLGGMIIQYGNIIIDCSILGALKEIENNYNKHK